MPQLLFIRYSPPSEILEGGAQATQKNYNIVSALLGKENVTTFYICNETGKSSFAHYVKSLFWMLRGYFWGLSPQKVKEITHVAPQYDYVFIDRSVYGIIAKRLTETGYKGMTITFFHNVEKLYFKAKISSWKPWRYLIMWCAERNDGLSCKYSGKIIALNARDNQEIERRYHRSADELIPIVFKDKLALSDELHLTRRQPLCLFLGAYFKANNDGLLWFIRNVYPHVNIKMMVVGKWMSRLKEGYNIPEEIEIYSDVPDLTPFFSEADFMVFPIFSGSGMKVKTCESLMYGKNIIATQEAFEGYELDYEKVGGLCNNAQEFISRINYFSEHPVPRFNQYARRMFLEKYSEEAVVVKFRRLLE